LPLILYGKITVGDTEQVISTSEIIKSHLLSEDEADIKNNLVSYIIANFNSSDQYDLFEQITKTLNIHSIITFLEEAHSDQEIDEGKFVNILEFWIN
jgi:hypothetical protein